MKGTGGRSGLRGVERCAVGWAGFAVEEGRVISERLVLEVARTEKLRVC